MLSNYLKIAFRSLLRQRWYSAINIVGLAICVATFLLSVLYVYNECTFDNFHPGAERTFRVTQEFNITKERRTGPIVSAGIANELSQAFPNDIEQIIRCAPHQTAFVRAGEKEFCEEERIAFADSSLLSDFSFPFLIGTPQHAFRAANSVVLTESMARKYFGTTDILGKTVNVRFEEPYSTGRGFIPLFVTGVISDLPGNTSFDFGILIPFAKGEELIKKNLPSDAIPESLWYNLNAETYIRFRKETNIAAIRPKVEQRIAKIEDSHKDNKELASQTFILQPLKDIHLNISGAESIMSRDERKGDIRQMSTLFAIALGILLIGCINYINFHTARATLRANEIGIRKTLGANRSMLIRQIFFETILSVITALTLSLCLVELALPMFNSLLGVKLSLVYILQHSPLESVCAAIGIFLMLVVLCGLYPAIFLSGFAPHTILRSYAVYGKRSGFLRKILVVLQFSLSILLMIGMLIMAQQLEFMRAKNLGFDKENIVMVKVRNAEVGQNIQPIKNALKLVSGVKAVSSCGSKLASDVMGFMVIPQKGEKSRLQYGSTVDADYATTMGLRLVSGSWYSSNPIENLGKIVINEEEMRRRQLAPKQSGTDKEVILGVVKNFHFASLRDPIEPLVFNFPYWKNEAGNVEQYVPYKYLAVRLAPGDYRSTLNNLEVAWKGHIQNEPFEYSFLDDDLNAMYRSESRIATLVNILGGIALLISCLGLLGLTAFTVERRTKEISIRKFLGASVSSIITLLSKDFLKLVGIAIIIATPLAYWTVGKWLQDFAYRTELSWWIFAAAGVSAVGIAFMTVAGQAFREAQANPVQSLRSE